MSFTVSTFHNLFPVCSILWRHGLFVKRQELIEHGSPTVNDRDKVYVKQTKQNRHPQTPHQSQCFLRGEFSESKGFVRKKEDRALKLKSATFVVAPNCLIVSLNIISFLKAKRPLLLRKPSLSYKLFVTLISTAAL